VSPALPPLPYLIRGHAEHDTSRDIAGQTRPGDTKEFARQELEGFFHRRDEQGKFYCAACLAEQLAREGTRGIVPATWLASIKNAFERSRTLHVEPRGSCAVCHQSRPCIGVPHPRDLSDSP